MTSNIESNYLMLQTKLLRYVGISFKEKEPFWYNVYSVLFTVFMWSFIGTVCYTTLYEHSQLDVLLENLSFGAAALNACSKMLALYRVRKPLGKTLPLLQKEVFRPNIERGGKLEENLLRECTFLVNAQVMVLVGITLINVFCTITDTVVSRTSYSDSSHWKLPYGRFAIFNVTSSPNFEAACVYQFTVVTVIVIGFVSVATFIAGVMAYIAYQLKMLQNFIRTFFAYTNKKLKQHEKGTVVELSSATREIQWKYLNQTLKEIVEYNTAIIDLAEKFEDLLNFPALADYLGLSLVICMAFFAASIYSTVNLRLINQINLAVGKIFLQFITAYWGNLVITESEAVARACYEADFIGTDIRFQKSWIAIMQRSQRPISFTVGKFAPLSLNTFLKVVQSSYSYFMMLHHFNEDKVI